ncbi:hypothetical protein OB955_21285 [Halobacteria archaeon AArc-m2/3/4]|uniref:Uncharacterized protein n=1 Tax=Natronoglomus mannanivorans TaxID=2979990 RepID=A0ABT2QJX6_9EURY|nr:hypothetical protein [Halobacteria archaeon AArc-m2/3/4]
MEIHYREPEDEHTERSDRDVEETRWMVREGVGVAVVSMFGLLVLVFGLLMVTGVVSFPAPLNASAIGTLSVFVALVLGLFVVSVWSWGGR